MGLALTTFVGGWIVVVTIRVCQELAPLQGQHAGCGIDVAAAGIALVIDATLAVAALVLVLTGRWLRRRSRGRRTRCDPPPPPMPPWWYPPA